MYGMDAREGASHLGDSLGMHFNQPEEQQIMNREIEDHHHHKRHAATRYDPDVYTRWEHEDRGHDHEDPHAWEHDDQEHDDQFWRHEAHIDSHDLEGHQHREAEQRYEHHSLPVHDRFGQRALEQDPMHHEFVHGTNYEMMRSHAAPVIEHNPHAFSIPEAKKPAAKKPEAAKKPAAGKKPADKEALAHRGDVMKLPAPVEPMTEKASKSKKGEAKPAEKR